MYKYETINGWTKETMIAHIMFNFNGKSVTENELYGSTTCLYRGPNETKCAVGMFIPDENYDKGMEHNNANGLLAKFPALKGLLPLEGEFMSLLQTVHDNSNPKNTLDNMIKWVEDYVA